MTKIPHVEFKYLQSDQEIKSILSRILQNNGTSSSNRINEFILRAMNSNSHITVQEDNNALQNCHMASQQDYNATNFQMHI